jgi:hypothetical protein
VREIRVSCRLPLISKNKKRRCLKMDIEQNEEVNSSRNDKNQLKGRVRK